LVAKPVGIVHQQNKRQRDQPADPPR